MAQISQIEWTQATWNPVTGCTKISAGCEHCYAERMAKRLHAMGQPNYKNGFALTLHPHLLSLPLKWRKPRMIFVNSMSDLFHPDVPDAFIWQVIDTMAMADRHVFQVLTKRSSRMREFSRSARWPSNVWLGVTVERADYLSRIDDLRQVDAAVRFLSLEPLLGPLEHLELESIDWVIVGGESGPRARPIKEQWVLDIRDRCTASGVAFFFKQWGGVRKKANGRILRGRTWEQLPVGVGSVAYSLLPVG